jgi:hypothetical protein
LLTETYHHQNLAQWSSRIWGGVLTPPSMT